MSLRSRKPYNNDKPWFSPQLKRLRGEKEAARRGGDSDLLRQAKYRFTKAVKEAKHRYAERLQHQLSEGNPSFIWKGLKKITNYRPKPPQTPHSLPLANELNEFYCRFEKVSRPAPSLHPPGSQPPLHPPASPLSLRSPFFFPSFSPSPPSLRGR